MARHVLGAPEGCARSRQESREKHPPPRGCPSPAPPPPACGSAVAPGLATPLCFRTCRSCGWTQVPASPVPEEVPSVAHLVLSEPGPSWPPRARAPPPALRSPRSGAVTQPSLAHRGSRPWEVSLGARPLSLAQLAPSKEGPPQGRMPAGEKRSGNPNALSVVCDRMALSACVVRSSHWRHTSR